MTFRFNDGQRAAVESRASKIVVSAGAGSGKTRVLAERFADAVLGAEAAGSPAPLGSVLLITFTDKAAGELVERVRRVLLDRCRPDLAREVDSAWISTIHGFCAKIVRRHALELGVDPAFGVITEPQVGIVCFGAFERAATGLLEERGVARLIAEHGVASLRNTVLAAYDRVRSKGMCVGEVVPARPGDLDRTLRGLRDVLDSTADAYGQLKQTETVQGNMERFRALREAVEGLLDSTAQGRLRDAAGLLAYRGALKCGAEAKELTEQVNLAITGACQAAVDTIAGDDAAAWCMVLQEYERVYEQAKATLGVLDFEDLQLLARRLWREYPRSARRYAGQFRQVMVDEFQDTNGLQFQAIEPVAAQALCLVGDVQQSIYRFRDADVSLFVEQQRIASVPGGGEACELTVNYRSHPELLDTFNALFESRELFGDDYLHLDHEVDRPSTVVWPSGSPRTEAILVDKRGWVDLHWRDAEARSLAQRLRALVDEGRMTADDIVVLVRTTGVMPLYVEALRAVGFEVHAGAAGGFFATPEVADARALLRVLANPLDGEGVLRLLAGGFGSLSDDALHLLASSCPAGGLWDALPRASEIGLCADDVRRADLILATVNALRAGLGRMRLADAVLHAVDVLAPSGGGLDRPEARANLGKVARLAAEFERIAPSDPAAFLHYLDDRESFVPREPSAGTAVEGSGAIRVMTVHAAKGLEFPVVVVADLGHARHSGHAKFMVAEEEGRLTAVARVPLSGLPKGTPEASAWREAGEADDLLELAEAKRVFYVACTRAEQVLLLTGSADPSKEPGADTAIDWLRCVVDGAGAEGLPGFALAMVTSAQEPELATDDTDPTPPTDDHRVDGSPRPIAALKVPGPIASPEETSYTALALYERCAYRFFAERVLGMGTVDIVDGNDPRALGSALHGALQSRAEGRLVDAVRLRTLAVAHGMASDELPRLTAAFEAFLASSAGPLLERGTAEVPFAVPVVGGVVAGSMDLVVRDGTTATVIDYKTGRGAAPDGSRYGAQAEIYALALLAAGCDRVAVRFVRVEEGCVETVFTYDSSARDGIVEKVEDAFARMAAREYPRLRAFDAGVCPDCPVSGSLCPVVHPGGRTSRRS